MASFHYLTKSRYLQGMQCPKLLWLSINEPDSAKETDEATRHVFDVGTKVGELARKRFENGVLIKEDHMHLTDAVRSTQTAVKSNTPAIFEATAKADNILCRADIFKRVPGKKQAWEIHEVKMGTKVKEINHDDLAMQRCCFERAGYEIQKTCLVHVNNKYVRKGDIDPMAFLTAADITEVISDKMEDTKKNMLDLSKVLNGRKCPDAEPGDQCLKPYECPFYDRCNLQLPEYSVWELPDDKSKRAATLEEMGIELLKDIPDDFKLSYRQKQTVISAKTKKPAINKDAIQNHLDSLEYPLYYFDFETIAPAIPVFDNSRPYQNIPFQFSLHIQKKKDGACEHHEFLLKERCDPRLPLIKEMLPLLGQKGSIVAYNMTFEKTRIKELAAAFPDYSKKLLALIPRFWDLIIPFKKGNYAHYDFRRSASLKAVLPVLVPSLSYKNLEIQEGGSASLKYEQWITGEMKPAEWEKTYENLLKYCGLDTLAMVEILKVLYNVINDLPGSHHP